MKEISPAIEVQEWQPPAAPGAAVSARPLASIWQQPAVIAVVGGCHIAAIAALLSLKPPPEEMTRSESADRIIATIVEWVASAPEVPVQPADSFEWRAADVELKAPPELSMPEADDAQDSTVRVRQDFLPPRLDESSRLNTADFARRAGVQPGRSVRIILAVTVTEQGTAGDVQVSISSGDSRVDELAVEYARALRWSPAIVQGRNASMNIRLPVVLTMPG